MCPQSPYECSCTPGPQINRPLWHNGPGSIHPCHYAFYNTFWLVQHDRDASVQGHCVSGTIHLWDQGSQKFRTGTHRFGTSRYPTKWLCTFYFWWIRSYHLVQIMFMDKWDKLLNMNLAFIQHRVYQKFSIPHAALCVRSRFNSSKMWKYFPGKYFPELFIFLKMSYAYTVLFHPAKIFPHKNESLFWILWKGGKHALESTFRHNIFS